MNAPVLPPPAALRRARLHFRRHHRRPLAIGATSIAGTWAVVAALSVGSDGGSVLSAARSLVASAAAAASLTIVVALWVGHVALARLRWPRHFARLPRLVVQVLEEAGTMRGPATGAVVGAIGALVVPPAVALGPAAAAVGLTITPVGYALTFAWHTAAVARRTVSGSGGGWTLATRRAALLAGGLAAGIVTVARAPALDGDCLATWILAAPCGTSPWLAATAAAVGGLFAFPLFAVYGALVSLTLDEIPLGDVSRGEPDGA